MHCAQAILRRRWLMFLRVRGASYRDIASSREAKLRTHRLYLSLVELHPMHAR